MRWQTKAVIQAVLSRVPLGYALHRRLQDLTGSSRLDIRVQYARKARFLGRIREQGLAIEGSSCLEIGTGWHPVLPLLLRFMGAREVYTIDINPWLTQASLCETLAAVSSIADDLESDFGLNAKRCRGEIDGLLERASTPAMDPRDVLKSAGVHYLMPEDATGTRFPDGRFDFILSSNLLEHVPPQTIRGMLVESRRILKSGGVHLHHINPGDHFSFDSRITTINFLKYSPASWHYIGGSGLAYHNRLRCVDYVRMFEKEGFEIAFQSANVDERALHALRDGRLRLHPDYAAYSQEELCADLIDVFARRP